MPKDFTLVYSVSRGFGVEVGGLGFLLSDAIDQICLGNDSTCSCYVEG